MKRDGPPPEELLAHRGFLRALAYRLLSDRHAADDVVQQTFLAALERPPRRGSLRAWLGTVARNLALKRRRTATRRAGRETAAARPEEVPSAAEVAAQLEIQKRVVAAVADLEEPYRSTVVLRFFHELKPGEIAKSQGVPVRTVRTRLQRALEQLRARLDREHGSRRAWALPLVPFAALWPGAMAPPAASTAGVTLMLSINRRVVFVLLVFVLLAGVLVFQLSGKDESKQRTTVDHARRHGSKGVTNPTDGPKRDKAAQDWFELARSDPSRASGPDVHLAGIVLLRGVGVRGAEVRAVQTGSPFRLGDYDTIRRLRQILPPEPPLSVARTDEAGRFALRIARRTRVSLEITAPRAALAKVRIYLPGEGHPDPVRIHLEEARSLRGLVVDPARSPLPGARVRARYTHPNSRASLRDTRTDEHGRFELPGVAEQMTASLVASAPGHVSGTARTDGAQVGDLVILLGKGGSIAGIVRDAGGEPLSGITVLLATKSGAMTKTDRAGRYRITDLAEGPIEHVAVFAAGHALYSSWLKDLVLPPDFVRAGEELSYDITLPPLRKVSGLVLSETEQKPLANIEVQLYRVARGSWFFPVAHAHSGPSGAFVFPRVPPGSYRLGAAGGEWIHAAKPAPTSQSHGPKVEVEVDSDPPEMRVEMIACGSVEGRVHGLEQFGLGPGGSIRAQAGKRYVSAVVDALGNFRFERVPAHDEVVVRISKPPIESDPVRVVAGQKTRVDLHLGGIQSARGLVTGDRGEPVANAFVWIRPKSQLGPLSRAGRASAAQTAGRGRFRAPFPTKETPGELELVVHHAEYRPVTRVVSRPGPNEEVTVEIQLERGLAIEGRVVWADGSPVPEADVLFYRADAPTGYWAQRGRFDLPRARTRADGEFRFRGLLPGDYKVWALHDRGTMAKVKTPAGQRVTLLLQPTLSISGLVLDEEGKRISAARITAYIGGDQQGSANSTTDGGFVMRHLEGGSYTLKLAPGKRSDWYPPRLDPFIPMQVEGVASGTHDLVVRVQRGRLVRGRVQGSDGKLLQSALVVALARNSDRNAMLPHAKSGKNGAFELPGLGAEHVDLLVAARGFLPEVVALPAPGTEVRITLRPGLSIGGILRTSTGKPHAKVWVSLMRRSPRPFDDLLARAGKTRTDVSALVSPSAPTDDQGRFLVTGLTEGEYTLSAWLRKSKEIFPAVTVRAGETNVVLQTSRPVAIRGYVVDPAGLPLKPGKGAHLFGKHKGQFAGSAILRPDGTFELLSVSGGRVTLYVWPGPGYRQSRVEVEAGALDVRITAEEQPR